MKHTRFLALFFFGALLFGFSFTACSSGGGGGGGNDSSTPSTDERTAWVVHWNRITIDASGFDHTPQGAGEQKGPVRSIRAVSTVSVAVADAVGAITNRFTPFLSLGIEVSPTASLRAAIAQAAHDTLVEMFKKQKSVFDAALAEELAQVPDGTDKEDGIAVGKLTAKNILDLCKNDHSDESEPFVPVTYKTKPDVGKWRVDPFNPQQKAIGSTWYKVQPLVMTTSSQFRLPPPPAVDSAEYAEAYNEVKRLGGDGVTTPTERTEDQTIAGIFWAYDGTPSLCAPPRLYNQLTVQLGLERGLDMPELARLLALTNVAMNDAGIASWDSKFFYEFWRPVTGIQEADAGTGPTGAGDNNPGTQGDPSFRPLGAPASNTSGIDFTPPFPSYPSGHATFGGALFETLRTFFGTDDVKFTFVSDEFNGLNKDIDGNSRPLVPRSFHSLSQAEEENGQSRIYLGIHWSFDKTGGITQGRQVADLVSSTVYLPK